MIAKKPPPTKNAGNQKIKIEKNKPRVQQKCNALDNKFRMRVMIASR